MFRALSLAATLASTACSPESRALPKTSAESAELQWLDHADVAADFQEHVERQRDTRFVSVYGFSTPSVFGLDDTPEIRALIQRHGERTLKGTDDIITSSERRRLRGKAHEYAKQYNSLLLRYLRSQPTSNQSMKPTAGSLAIYV
jgi:hypothetical protein